jgi:hypothetical protein
VEREKGDRKRQPIEWLFETAGNTAGGNWAITVLKGGIARDSLRLS